MRELVKLVMDYDYAPLLFKRREGKSIEKLAFVLEISKDDPRYQQIPTVIKEVREKHNVEFLLNWDIQRRYTKKEFEEAETLRMLIKSEFEPAGETMGTIYDDDRSCPICGANGKQVGPLRLKKSSIPKKDIAKTIAGEVIVSAKLVSVMREANLKGWEFAPVMVEKGNVDFYQLAPNSPQLNIGKSTVAGISPFDLSESAESSELLLPGGIQIKDGKEVYKCPKGHTIGLNILSELYVKDVPSIKQYDCFETKQKVGVRRGLLRQEPLYLCSNAFRYLVEKEQLKGFSFEVAHVE